ncbi:MAG: heme-binding protein [Gammaproteobacteria bacterium]|nr:heme-binding protein [Gammaproteobacteria bacterium]
MNKTTHLWVASCIATPLALAQAPPGPPSATAAQAQQPAARGPALELALEAAEKAVEACRGLDQKVGVTVVDSAGVFKVVLATDGASTRGVQSSTNKALTALAFGAATSELGDRIQTDTALAQKIAANANYNTRAGGILIKLGDDVIGAIGVGGAKGSEKDEACAIAGLQKVQGKLK